MPRDAVLPARAALYVLLALGALAGPAEGARSAPPTGPRLASRAAALIDDTGRMNANNLDMFVTNHGSFASDRQTGNAGLIYPRGSGKTAIFAAGIWIGAKVAGETRLAVGEYSQEYAPGPMLDGTFQPDNARFKCYRINRGDDATTNPDYANWPVEDGAPVDAQGNPLLSGDATIWSVYNDADPSRHTNEAGSTAPLGVEVQQTTYAFNNAGPLGNIIFMKFKILNKGGNTLNDTYVSVWCDPDLGGADDDLVGCDTTRSLGYCYNATNSDLVYGATPPAVGFDFFRGPIVQVSPGVYDTLGMSSFNKYINGTDPSSPAETYNYMQGLNADGTPVHVRDDPSQPITRYRVPGDPVVGTGWLDTNPSDRRMMLSTGPFTMAPGGAQEIVVALIVGQGTDRLSSITDLEAKDTVAQLMFDLPPPLLPLAAALDLDPDTINLKSRAPWVTAYIQPAGSGPAVFAAADIQVGTLRLAGSVPPDSKLAVLGDHDRNGVPDLMVKFPRSALDPLLAPGTVMLSVTGLLGTGAMIQGSDQIRIIDPPNPPLYATVAPNPFNPSALLRFATSRPGPARVALYDVRGRLVRSLLEAPFLPAGSHEIAIDGRDGRGGPLPSGVYLYRIEADGAEATGRIVLMK